MKELQEHLGKYDLVYADPPWPMYGDGQKNAAAAKHYDLMTLDAICDLPVRALFRDQGALFLWATCPRLDIAMSAIKAWGLHYRGVAFVWVKCRKDGAIIGAQGVPPTATKPTTELCLLATTCKRGRPLKLQSSKVSQVIVATRGKHSEKPSEARDRIVEVYGDRPRIELFARTKTSGWNVYGNEV